MAATYIRVILIIPGHEVCLYIDTVYFDGPTLQLKYFNLSSLQTCVFVYMCVHAHARAHVYERQHVWKGKDERGKKAGQAQNQVEI